MKNVMLKSQNFTAAVVGFCLTLFSFQAQAVEIQEITTDSGLKVLLVEDYTVPLIALQFSFKGGAAQDATGKEGTANLLTTLLDEGAGDLDSQTLQQRLDDVGMSYSFRAGRDFFTGGMKTLKSNANESFDLMALMINSPRFDAEPVGRMKNSAISRLKGNLARPQAIASKAMRETLFADHPYGRPVRGDLETVGSITPEDVADYHKRVFARENLILGVVGAISADDLKPIIDKMFGNLPAKADLVDVPAAKITTGKDVHVDFNVPQTTISLTLPGIKRDDPDFYAGYLVNYILGGGSFSSRLYTEVREKRGLAYGVYSYLGTYESAGIVGGGSATGTETTDKAIKIILDEFRRMAEEGPTADELEKAKQYITGSYAIQNLDTSDKIASVLVAIQQANLGLDYIDKRAEYISAVTLDDAKRVSKRLFSGDPTLVTVGAPLKK